jgi:carboxymethylenebutenolidase
MGELVDLADDVKLYVAKPAGGEGPGVIVLHAWWGLNDFFKSVCDRLAEQGFVAAAPDFYHGEVGKTIAEAQALNRKYEEEEPVTRIVAAAASYLKTCPGVAGRGIAALGASMGAWWSCALAVMEPELVRAVVLFYGTAQQDFSKTRAAFQGHFAEQDPYESAEDVHRLEGWLKEAGREMEFHRYPGTKHWFIETDRPEYAPQAARLAWERTLAFLHHHLDSQE